MSLESVALKRPHLYETLMLAKRIWDHRGEKMKEIEVFNADYEFLKKLGIEYVDSHKIIRGRVKAKRSRKPKESLI